MAKHSRGFAVATHPLYHLRGKVGDFGCGGDVRREGNMKDGLKR